MNKVSLLIAVCLSVCLLLLIFELVRKNKLKEKYALVWLIIGVTILIFAIFDKILLFVTVLFGIKLPINTMFFLGIFFIIIINLHFSMVISNLEQQNKRIVQELALLEAQLSCLRKAA